MSSNEWVYCFSYGSNMSTARLCARAPSARFVIVARLPEHRLRFHKIGMDGSGKCDAEFTGDSDDFVIGVVFGITACDKRLLDLIEGVGSGYDEKEVEVVTEDGRTLRAMTYVATRTNPSLRPFDWYRRHVLTGAREHGLPADYIAHIEAVEADNDGDQERSERESTIYRQP